MSQMYNPKTASITHNSEAVRSNMDKEMRSDEKTDFTKSVPDDVLSYILSFLSIDEAVRSCILSKKWKNLWKNTSHIEFNSTKMIRPLSQLLLSRESQTTMDLKSITKGVSRYGFLVYRIIFRHIGDLCSCSFLHLWKSLLYGELQSWVEYLLRNKKGMKNLKLECELDNGEMEEYFIFKDDIPKLHFSHGIFATLGSLELINYTINCSNAFVGCKNLQTLKLERINLDDATINDILNNCVVLENIKLNGSTGFKKLIIINQSLKVLQLECLCVDELKVSCENLEVLFLDSIICPTNAASIYTPNLTTFSSYCYSKFGKMHGVDKGHSILKACEILQHSSMVSSFQ
ncbi:PREDICTED: F-box protein At1g80960-like [Lupinus angustifolius]|uniref:F-box protein At1g80960-like n=1 Tax=Lupinus angustifolius TaxID=3871 RepID=UPI00092F174D|nr:PREDICTED: F-box protein At1g80960-like [Lupinus angustifolius]